MNKTYRVKQIHTLAVYIEVEAETPEQAKNLVKQGCGNETNQEFLFHNDSCDWEVEEDESL